MSIDNDKFQFIGEMNLNRICHGFVAVAISLSSVGQYLVFVSSNPSDRTMDCF